MTYPDPSPVDGEGVKNKRITDLGHIPCKTINDVKHIVALIYGFITNKYHDYLGECNTRLHLSRSYLT